MTAPSSPDGTRPVLMDGVGLSQEMLVDLRHAMVGGAAPRPCLATVRVGDDEEGARYVGYKHAAAEAAGMAHVGVTLPASATQDRVEDAVGRLDARADVHGIFVQLPLPPELDTQGVMDTIDPIKDVDGLTATNLGRLVVGQPGHVPCAPLGALRLLCHYGALGPGLQAPWRAVVLGRSAYVALPLALLLGRHGATVTVVATRDAGELREQCLQGDIVVSDLCCPGMITGEWVRPGAAVVDMGLSRVNGMLVGDVDVASVGAVAGWVAPNPGGVGPMTVALLLEATVRAARATGAVAVDL